MRILFSMLLVFGIVAGLGAAFRGPHGAYGPRYGSVYGGPCAPGWYGPGGTGAPWWGTGAPPTSPAPSVSTPATPAPQAGPPQ